MVGGERCGTFFCRRAPCRNLFRLFFRSQEPALPPFCPLLTDDRSPEGKEQEGMTPFVPPSLGRR